MTAEVWALDDVRQRLIAAGEQGEMLTVAALREAIGIGHDDLTDVLNTLREAGDAVEGAPNEWRAPYDDELESRAGGEAAADDGSEEDADDERGAAALREHDERARRRGQPLVAPIAASGAAPTTGEVVLTMAVAKALDPETIGKLVEAGINESSEADRAFVLRVEPSADAAA